MSQEYSRPDTDNMTVGEKCEVFLRRYYDDQIKRLAENYPNEQQSLYVDWGELYRFDADLADDYITAPGKIHEHLDHALGVYDVPIDVDLSGANLRVTGLNNEDIYRPSDLRSEHSGTYVGIKGVLDRVTTPSEKPIEVAFICQRCGSLTHTPQTGDEFQEPYECMGCERQGPFKVEEDQSEWTDYCKLRIETPPDESGDLGDEKFVGFAEGDLVNYGHDAGLLGRVGENCTVYGVVERKQKQGRNANDLLFDRVLRVEAVEFDNDEDTVDVEAHREEFEELASQPNAVDLFAESLVPELYATPAWEHGLELGVAYLFAAPRIDIPQGPSYRGDIHALVMSGYGMGKSMFNSALAAYSPKAIKKSATALSSDVGLLAAAVKDDFGDGQWTVKPGILVRGNGGHVILDEIDKTGAELARMNDALEGEQKVDVEKAGQSVTYQSRIGLFATGNPKDGRFNDHEPVSEQLDVKPSLLSRFDGIVTMRDVADEELDAKVADAIGTGYAEAQELQFGDREDKDSLERPVSVNVGRAWVKEARENCNPLLQRHHVEDIKEWYSSDVRQMNEKYANNEGVGANMPVPATARVVEGTIRFSVAFARCHLRSEVADTDVKRAKTLMKALIGQTFDSEDGTFTPPEISGSEADQLSRVDRVKKVIREGDGLELDDVIERMDAPRSKVEHDIDNLKQKGEVYEPSTGELRTT